MKSIYSVFGDILLFLIFVCILVIPSLALINLTPAIASKKIDGEIAGVVDNADSNSSLVYQKVEVLGDFEYTENIIPLSDKTIDKYTKNYSFKISEMKTLAKEQVTLGKYKFEGNKEGKINIKITPSKVIDDLLFQVQTEKFIKEISSEINEVSIIVLPNESSEIKLNISALKDIRDLDFNVLVY